MPKYDVDLFVIGAGSGGVRAARMSAGHGARVAVAEEFRYGGTCVIRGCVPKKLLAYAADFHEAFEDAAGFGWTVEGARFDWATLIANKDREIARLEGIYRNLLTGAGAQVFEGRAVLADPHTIEVNGRRITAETILVATGGRPVKPPVPGADLMITSNEALHLDRLPGCVAVLGGGYIACEFAGIFNALGAKTLLLHRGERLLRGFDEDVRRHLAEEIAKKGVDLRLLNDAAKVERRADGGLLVTLIDGKTVEADCVMAATGRTPNTEGMGLREAGVALTAKGAVQVDEWSKSSVPSIYAVGDVTDRINLTPVALHEGHCFADTVYGRRPRKADHAAVAAAVFSHPNVATVGLSEDAARDKHSEVTIFRSTFTPLKHTLSKRPARTLMKLVVETKTDRLLGVHMVGDDAPEIVQGMAIAVKAGLTKAQVDATIGIHPTAAEEFVTMRTPVAPPAPARAAE
jgi:glutathione reductase (NADPH)